MKHEHAISPFLGAAAVLIATALCWSCPTAPERPATLAAVVAEPAVAATPMAIAVAPPTPVVAEPVAEPAVAAPAAVDAVLRYPDGSTRPTLNGVTEAMVPSFNDNVPFTKIVGTETDARGLTWYVHENGALSTTFLDGRGLPFAMCCMPMPQPR